MRSRLIAAAAAVTLGGAAMTAAVPAQAAEPSPFTVGGTQTKLSTATGSAPDLQPGLYNATLPLDTAHHYAKVTRRAGESLAVTVTGAAAEKGHPYFSTAEHTLKVALVLPDGTSCTEDEQSQSADDSFGLLDVSATLDAKESKRDSYLTEDCAAATTFLVDVTRTAPADAGEMPAELLVTREPKTSGGTGSPAAAADLKALQAMPKESTSTVKPGHGFSDAPTLKPGTTNVDLAMGDRLFYKVRLGWGQRLAASVELPRNGSNFAMQVDTESVITIYSPQRKPLKANGSTTISDSTTMFAQDGKTKTIGSFTAPVSWANRGLDYSNAGDVGSDAAQWTTASGWYYVSVRTSPYDTKTTRTDLAAIPARLTVEVSGTAGKGPSYVDSGGQAISQPGPGQVSQGGEDDSSSFPWVTVGGSAVAVLLAGGAVLWALRQRRRSA